MAQASVQDRTARRTLKAAGIVTRREVVPVDGMDGYYQVSDSETGSGKVYLVNLSTCTCPDFIYRGNVCKHILSARAEHEALMTYAAAWDALTRPTCPMCGSPIEPRSFYVGGRGYVYADVCSGDATHSNRRPLESLPAC